MFLIYVMLFLISSIIAIYKDKTLFSPITIISVAWNIFPALSTFGLLGMNKPIFIVHIFCVIAWLFFMVGYLLSSKAGVSPLHSGEGSLSENDTVTQFNDKLIIIIGIAVIIYMIPYTSKALKILESNDAIVLRNNFETEVFTSTIDNIIYTWFVFPFKTVSSAYVAFSLFSKRKHSILLYIVTVINILLNSVTLAARALLVMFVFYIFFALFFVFGFKWRKEMTKTKKFVFYTALVFLAIILVTITADRMGYAYEEYSFIDSAVLYYISPFSLLSHYIDNPSFSMINQSYLFGGCMLGFVYNVFCSAIFLITGAEYAGTDHIITSITSQNVGVGGINAVNSVTTAIYPMMRDFGWVGIVIGFFAIGLLIGIVKNKINIKNERICVSYIILLYILFKLEMNYEPLSPSIFFTFLYVFLLSRKKKTVNEVGETVV